VDAHVEANLVGVHEPLALVLHRLRDLLQRSLVHLRDRLRYHQVLLLFSLHLHFQDAHEDALGALLPVRLSAVLDHVQKGRGVQNDPVQVDPARLR